MKRSRTIVASIITFSAIAALFFNSCSDKPPVFKFGATGDLSFEMQSLSNQYVVRGGNQLSRVDKRSTALYDLTRSGEGFNLTAMKLKDEIRIDGAITDSPVARASDSIPITFKLDSNGLATKATGFDKVISRLDSILGDHLSDLPQSSQIFAQAIAGEVEEWNQRITPFLGREAIVGDKFYFEKNLTESFGKVHCYFYVAVKKIYQTERWNVAEVLVVGCNSITRLAFEVEEPADSIQAAFGLSDQTVDSLSALPVKVIRNAKRVIGVNNLLSLYEESRNTVSRREIDSNGDTTMVRQITESVSTMFIDGSEALSTATPRDDNDLK